MREFSLSCRNFGREERRERKEGNEEEKNRRRKVRVRFRRSSRSFFEGTSLPHSGSDVGSEQRVREWGTYDTLRVLIDHYDQIKPIQKRFILQKSLFRMRRDLYSRVQQLQPTSCAFHSLLSLSPHHSSAPFKSPQRERDRLNL